MTQFDKQAAQFLEESETSCEIRFLGRVNGFPFDDRDHYPHNKYLVILKRAGKSYHYDFYDSYSNTVSRVRPTKYSVLATLESYPVDEDMWDFANEYGYEINSRYTYERVKKIHQACLDQYEALLNLFGEEWLERLREIN